MGDDDLCVFEVILCGREEIPWSVSEPPTDTVDPQQTSKKGRGRRKGRKGAVHEERPRGPLSFNDRAAIAAAKYLKIAFRSIPEHTFVEPLAPLQPNSTIHNNDTNASHHHHRARHATDHQPEQVAYPCRARITFSTETGLMLQTPHSAVVYPSNKIACYQAVQSVFTFSSDQHSSRVTASTPYTIATFYFLCPNPASSFEIANRMHRAMLQRAVREANQHDAMPRAHSQGQLATRTARSASSAKQLLIRTWSASQATTTRGASSRHLHKSESVGDEPAKAQERAQRKRSRRRRKQIKMKDGLVSDKAVLQSIVDAECPFSPFPFGNRWNVCQSCGQPYQRIARCSSCMTPASTALSRKISPSIDFSQEMTL